MNPRNLPRQGPRYPSTTEAARLQDETQHRARVELELSEIRGLLERIVVKMEGEDAGE